MMFVKGKDEALLKSITGIMSKTAQQTEEQRKKAAQYLEKTTYAGMRLSEAMDWEPEEPAKEPTEAQKKESDRIKATTGKRNKEALEKISAAFAKKKVDETVELTQEEIARLEEIAQGTTPKTAREKDLAAKAEPKDKITHKDVMVARGVAKEEVELEEAVGDNHLHVQQVKHEGQTKYKVHAVGKNFADGIKVGEHLSDTELDDFSEMGGKIKHVKPAAAKPMKEARSLAAILDEARGRPSKKASEEEDEDDEGPDTGPEADQNIMVHLRKSTDTDGNHDVKFSDGSSHKVPAGVAHKVLGAMEKLKPADRAKIQSHIQQSHANLMAVHKMVS